METSPFLARTNSISSSSAAKTRSLSRSLPDASSFFPDTAYFKIDSPATYVSLRDMIARSPTTKGQSLTCSGIDISIRNRLVKQAAWSYLQPMPPLLQGSSSNKRFFVRFWEKLSQELKHPVSVCLRFINQHVVKKISMAFRKLFWVMTQY